MTRTLLVVDDDPAILRSIKRAFWQSGFTLETADAPDSAIQILELQEVDIVITDMCMPVMTGTELLRLTAEKYPQTSRILFSGFSAELQVIEGIVDGNFISFFHKPWKIDEMMQYINRIFIIRSQLGAKYLCLANQKPASLMTGIDMHSCPSLIDADTLASSVQHHPGLMLSVLRVASSYFHNEKIDTLQKAVALLGLSTARKLLAPDNRVYAAPLPEIPITGAKLMNHREYTCLFVDKLYFNVLKKTVPPFLHLACLLQNWGILLYLQKYRADYGRVMEQYGSAHNNRPLIEIETEILGLSSIRLCSLLFSYWNIDRQIVDCLSASAAPSEATSAIREEAAALHIASYFAWQKISSGEFIPFDASALAHFSLQHADTERFFGF